MDNNTTLMKAESFLPIIESAPVALQTNRLSAENAIKYGQDLIAKIGDEGMSDEMDQQCNTFLVKLKKTCTAMNERRKGITQLFDEVKKAFTTLEGQIDQKSEIYKKVQEFRDAYAAEKIRKQQEAEREAKRKLAIENEKIAIRALIEEGISKHVSDYITTGQKALLNWFEGSTLETFAENEKLIRSIPVVYPTQHLQRYKSDAVLIYISLNDMEEIKRDVIADKLPSLMDAYERTITAERDAYVDKLPSKKLELEAIARANAEEAERLRLEAEQRKKEEEQRLAKESEDRTSKTKAEVEANKEIATANSLFDTQMETAQAAPPPAQVRESFEIIVKNPLGYLALISFYFEREGKTSTVESLEKKTLGSIKTYCEGVAKKTGEIINNPYLQYKETYKTVAKK